MTGSLSRPVTFAAGKLLGNPGIYTGFALRETTGAAAAVVRLWDNTSAASGQLLDTIQLPQGTDDRADYVHGIWAVNGIFAEVVSGSVEGVVLTC